MNKIKELYSVIVDKLYSHFVENKGEAKIETVVDILEVLAPLMKEEKDPESEVEKEEYLI